MTATAVIVLLGWAFEIPVLRSGYPNSLPVKANAALGLCLGGIALQLITMSSSRARRWGRLLAVLMVAIGGLTMLEYASAVDFGIDQLLFRDPFGSPPPGRMAPVTTLLLVLLGLTLLPVEARTRAEFLGAQTLALAAGLISGLSVIGYVNGVKGLLRLASYVQIAPVAAIACLALSVGVLLARPSSGLVGLARSRSAGGVLLRRMLPVALLLPPLLGWLRLRAQAHGLVDTELGVSLIVLGHLAIFGAVTWWSARALHIQDVERQHGIVALRESDERFRLLVDGVSDYAIYLIDTAGKVMSWNRGAERLKGYPADEIVGRDISVFFLPDDVAAGKPRALLARAAAEGRAEQEAWMVRSDGSRFWCNMVVSALRDEAGEFRGFADVTRDISARKAAEDRLSAYATKLERSNRELESFASVASHDLQEPLRKIRAFGDRLATKQGEQLGPEGRDYLERMRGAATRMQDLIENLLSFSRVTTKAQPFARVDLADVAREVALDLESRVEQTRGRIDLGELPVLEADATQMRQLLQNLIGNALKFHRPDVPPVVKVTSRTLPAEDRGAGERVVSCEIRVADNGLGFEQQYAERIFGLFQRLHGRSEFEGTGIGLAICRKIVERHHGVIAGIGTPGDGATFTVTLPLRQREEIPVP